MALQWQFYDHEHREFCCEGNHVLQYLELRLTFASKPQNRLKLEWLIFLSMVCLFVFFSQYTQLLFLGSEPKWIAWCLYFPWRICKLKLYWLLCSHCFGKILSSWQNLDKTLTHSRLYSNQYTWILLIHALKAMQGYTPSQRVLPPFSFLWKSRTHHL